MVRTPYRYGTVFGPLAAIAVCSVFLTQSIGAELNSATHKQVRVIAPKIDGREVSLKTFCLGPTGDLYVCCATASTRRPAGVLQRIFKTASQSAMPRGVVQVYSPDGDVKKSFPLDFEPTAINLGPQGELFVAGEGQLCKLDTDGRELARTATPNIQDMEKFKKAVAEDAREKAQKSIELYERNISQWTTQIETITKIPQKDRTELQEKQLKSFEQRISMYERSLKAAKQRATAKVNVDALVKSKLRVSGLAVSSQDVFVSCTATKGYGYDVWRVDHDLKNPKEIVTGLRGCCRQMDIQCCGDDLLVAANTKFKVSRYDRDGSLKNEFGDNVRKSPEGFGSCCNPMNVRCTSEGEILTAESSIGNIKRFSAEGEFLGFVGKAKIGGGCKHCALGYDDKRDRYYMQHEDEHYICVLVPVSEAPEFTEEELQAKKASEG